jgi:hypothetical protein
MGEWKLQVLAKKTGMFSVESRLTSVFS